MIGLWQANSGKEAQDAIVHALKSGYKMLDSAQYYENERDVGEGIRASGIPREKIFVTTKLFTTAGGRAHAVEVIENSLKLMNIGYIDQYLLHAPQGGAVLECYDTLLEYQKKGLIKTVGVSNFGVKHLEALKKSGRPLPQTNQVELHPWCTREDICNWCRENGVQIVGYSPLVRTKKNDDPIVLKMADKYKKTPSQILVRYSLQKGWVTIPKSSKTERINENANVFDFELDKADMEAFDHIGRTKPEIVCWDPTVNDIQTNFGPLN